MRAYAFWPPPAGMVQLRENSLTRSKLNTLKQQTLPLFWTLIRRHLGSNFLGLTLDLFFALYPLETFSETFSSN